MTKATRDIIVSCEGGGHRVRMQGGLRFLKSARCPTCGEPVDPWRWRRVVRFLENLRRPASAHPADGAVWAATVVACVLALVGVALFRVTADLWWPATVVLFGPRWVVMPPLVPIAILATIRDRALLVPLSVATALFAGPFIGASSGVRGVMSLEGEDDLTVVTLNAAGGQGILYSPGPLMDRLGADVMMIQECGGSFRDSVLGLTEWHTAAEASLCAASRFPIIGLAVMDRANLQSVGGSALVATFSLNMDGRLIHVTNVHLETPRDGLELIRGGQIAVGAEILRQKSLLREIELRRAERWASEQGRPALVVGDFNTPPESRHLGRIWADWTDAFGLVGFGVGGTRLNGWIRARIDYVMADDSWSIVNAKAAEPVGSDHLPVVVRVRLTDRP